MGRCEMHNNNNQTSIPVYDYGKEVKIPYGKILYLHHERTNLCCVPTNVERRDQFVDRQLRHWDRAKAEGFILPFQSLVCGYFDE